VAICNLTAPAADRATLVLLVLLFEAMLVASSPVEAHAE